MGNVRIDWKDLPSLLQTLVINGRKTFHNIGPIVNCCTVVSKLKLAKKIKNLNSFFLSTKTLYGIDRQWDYLFAKNG